MSNFLCITAADCHHCTHRIQYLLVASFFFAFLACYVWSVVLEGKRLGKGKGKGRG